jgi:hypothetical protein
MKSILVITVFLFLLPSIQAQQHLDQTSMWAYYKTEWQGPMTTTNYRTITIDGDSTIQGQTYFKRYIQGVDQVLMGGPIPTSTIVPKQFFDLVRDDANYFYTNINGQDTAILDFTKYIGDSLFLGGMCADSISQIDTLFLGNTALRKWNFYSYGIIPYIEGVGSITYLGLGNDCLLTGNSAYGLVCYEKQGEQLILSPNINCQVYNSILNRELENTNIKIYPNPTFGQVQIEGLSSLEKTIELLNTNGQLIFIRQSNQENLSLNMAAYPKGAYFLRITSEKGTLTKKLIKM